MSLRSADNSGDHHLGSLPSATSTAQCGAEQPIQRAAHFEADLSNTEKHLQQMDVSTDIRSAIRVLLREEAATRHAHAPGCTAAHADEATHATSTQRTHDGSACAVLRMLAARGFTLHAPSSPAPSSSPLGRGALAATAAQSGGQTPAPDSSTAQGHAAAQSDASSGDSTPSHASLGSQPPRRGVRVLSVDGGGVRGMAVIEIVRKLEFEAGKPLREMFDLVVGVSTGAFLTGLLTAGRRTLPQAAELYEDMRVRMGSVPPLLQQLKRVTLGHSHSTEEARGFMQEAFGDGPMMSTAGSNDGPMFAAVATNVDVDPAQPYLFRSYELSRSAQERSLIRGSSDANLWAGVRASTSAPTYYEPEEIDGVRYVDGGVTANNPSLLAVAEAHALWPGKPIDLVVSIGTGEPVKRKTGPLGSVLDWMHVVFMTSLGSHMQHYLAHSLLPQSVYFRLDPADIGEVLMGESDEEKLSEMIQLTQLWCHSNHDRFAAIADIVAPQRERRGAAAPALWPPEGDFVQRVARVAGAPPLKVPSAADRVAQHISTDSRQSAGSQQGTVPSGAPLGGGGVASVATTMPSATHISSAQHEHTTYQMRPAALAVATVTTLTRAQQSGATCQNERPPAHPSPAAPAAVSPADLLQRSLAPFAPPCTPAAGGLSPTSRSMGLKQPLRQVQGGCTLPRAHADADAAEAGGHDQPAAPVDGKAASAAEANAPLRLTAADRQAVMAAGAAKEAKAGWMTNPVQK